MKSKGTAVSLRPLSPPERQCIILENLGLREERGSDQVVAVTDITLFSEVLRQSLWTLSGASETMDLQPVHITRLVNSAKNLIEQTPSRCFVDETQTDSSDWDEYVHTALRALMDELEDIGDFARLPRGFWLPSPFRLIPVQTIGRWIMVGGIPTRLLPSSVRRACEFSGAARLLNQDPSHLGLPLLIQSKEDWCQIPIEPADFWARCFLINMEMQEFEALETHYEYYAPGMLKSTQIDLQYYRWTDDLARLPDGRYLMRHRSTFGPIFYSVAEVRAKAVCGTASLDSQGGSIRRLQYGLDKITGVPTAVSVRRDQDGASCYILKNELPAAENRLFMTLGQLRDNNKGTYYPRIWRIAKGYTAEVNNALRHLGVQIVWE